MGRALIEILTYENPVLRNFCFWSAIMLMKMILMSILTGFQRYRTKTFANPEDSGKNNECSVNDKVERVRRAHLNDMENILPLVLISFIYMLSDPIPAVAINIFRVVTAARIWHTIVYAIIVIPQPARAIGFFIPYIAMFYMAIQSAIVFVN
ncbi:hypothetical protein HA402_008250 [Bradysia odoriphaga]|nr:hypothetical protein HA402_008250 [Bradysia odoriphaga]